MNVDDEDETEIFEDFNALDLFFDVLEVNFIKFPPL